MSLLRKLNHLHIHENKLDNLPNSIGFLNKLLTISSEYFIYIQERPMETSRVQTTKQSSNFDSRNIFQDNKD